MSLRIGTYLTLNSDNEVTSAGTAYNVDFSDLDVQASNNYSIQELRTGLHIIQHDSKAHFEVSGKLSISKTHLDEEGLIPYAGETKYLANNLWHHYKYHLPIEIFVRGIQDAPNKAYVCMITGFDPNLAGYTMATDGIRCHLPRGINFPNVLSFDFEILLVGAWTDYDDPTAVTWESREDPSS
jgi:hypothetical protein